MKKKFKDLLASVVSVLMLSCAVLLLISCSSDDGTAAAPQAPDAESATWTVIGEGALADGQSADGINRAVSIGGDAGNWRYFNWAGTETIYVYNSAGTQVGTLSVTVSALSTSLVTITGQGSLTGTFTPGETLTYYTPGKAQSFTDQKGTVADVSANHTFLKATPTVASVDAENHILTMNFASFQYAEAMAFFKFKDESGNWLRPEQLTIWTQSGKLVTSVAADGTPSYGSLVINTEQKDDMYPYELFVALKTDYTDGPETYLFQVKSGIHTYQSDPAVPASCYTRSNVYADGQYYAPAGITLPMKPIGADADNTISPWGDGGVTSGSTDNFQH